jgi:dihydroorotate dehydrogenase (fumarate)
MIDLTTKYLGLTLRNPLVVSANPLCESVANIRKMEDAGASAVVLHSLFEEQLSLETEHLHRYITGSQNSYAEALDYFPDMTNYNAGPDRYLDHIRLAKESVEIPIIASLNGVSDSGWIDFARKIEQAGADALELNIYDIPVDPIVSSAKLEQNYKEMVSHVCRTVTLPVTVKLHPFFTAIANVASNLDLAGARGLVLFNRFYQPDFDIVTREVVPRLELSTSQELLVRLHWTAILYGNIRADIAITGGVHSAVDVIKSMMVGARVVLLASALLRHGINFLSKINTEVQLWMEENEYGSIMEMQGSMSRVSCGEPAAFERVNYMRLLSEYMLKS